MHNKRGLSGVITVVIIILLVIVAIGIIWFFVGNLLETQIDEGNSSLECLEVDLTVEDVDCLTNDVKVKISRGNDEQTLSNVKIRFSNSDESKIIDFLDTSNGETLNPLEEKTKTFVFGTEVNLIPNKVTIFPVLGTGTSQDTTCQEIDSQEFNCVGAVLPAICGNGICEVSKGENPTTCPADCIAPTITNLCVYNARDEQTCEGNGGTLYASSDPQIVVLNARDDDTIAYYSISVVYENDFLKFCSDTPNTQTIDVKCEEITLSGEVVEGQQINVVAIVRDNSEFETIQQNTYTVTYAG